MPPLNLSQASSLPDDTSDPPYSTHMSKQQAGERWTRTCGRTCFFLHSIRAHSAVSGPATIFFCRPLPHPAAGWCTASTFFLPVPRSQHIDAQPMARPPALARSPLLYPAGGPAVARQPPWFGVGLWRHQHSHLPSFSPLRHQEFGIPDNLLTWGVGVDCEAVDRSSVRPSVRAACKAQRPFCFSGSLVPVAAMDGYSAGGRQPFAADSAGYCWCWDGCRK